MTLEKNEDYEAVEQDFINVSDTPDAGDFITFGSIKPGKGIVVLDGDVGISITATIDPHEEKKKILWAVFEIEQERRLAKEDKNG